MADISLRIRFDEIDGSIRIYDGIRYLTLFRSEKYEAIYNRIRCLIFFLTTEDLENIELNALPVYNDI